MRARMTVKGLESVVKNLNAKLNGITEAGRKGLIKGAFMIKADAQKGCPVVTGNLKNSAYVTAHGLIPDAPLKTTKWKHGITTKSVKTDTNDFNSAISYAQQLIAQSDQMLVIIGFAASYAFYVHESVYVGLGSKAKNKGKSINKGTFKSEVGGPKFLELAVRKNTGAILALVAEESKKEIK